MVAPHDRNDPNNPSQEQGNMDHIRSITWKAGEQGCVKGRQLLNPLYTPILYQKLIIISHEAVSV